MKFLQRTTFFTCLICAATLSAHAQNPGNFTITLDSANTTGAIHFSDGAPDQSLTGSVLPPHAEFFIASQYFFYHPMASAHEDIIVRYRIRYTEQQPGETLPTSFTGLVDNHSMATASPASSRPEGSTGAYVFAVPGPYGYGNPQSQDIHKYTPKTVSLSSTDSSGNNLTDANGKRYAEGIAELKATMDITGTGGSKQVGAELKFIQPKMILIVRTENQGPPTFEDNTEHGGFLERDEYSSDGSSSQGNSRYSNNIGLFGKDFGNENWTPALLGTPWPPSACIPDIR